MACMFLFTPSALASWLPPERLTSGSIEIVHLLQRKRELTPTSMAKGRKALTSKRRKALNSKACIERRKWSTNYRGIERRMCQVPTKALT